MLNDEQAKALLDINNLNFEDIFIVNCLLNQLIIPSRPITICLTETQKRLLICIFNKINNKRDIISVVWNDNHQRIRDNNYHQLVFQLRNLFRRHGLPPKIIITVPYYGLKLNEPLLRSLQEPLKEDNCLVNLDPLPVDPSVNPEEKKKGWLPNLTSFARSLFNGVGS